MSPEASTGVDSYDGYDAPEVLKHAATVNIFPGGLPDNPQ